MSSDFQRDLIFDGVEEKAINICKYLRKNSRIQEGWVAFGLLLQKVLSHDEAKVKDLTDELYKIVESNRGLVEENDLLVLQEAMKYIAGRASEEFKKAVESEEKV